jgi:hypothetical protein
MVSVVVVDAMVGVGLRSTLPRLWIDQGSRRKSEIREKASKEEDGLQ